jgi:hypothetical protein
MDAEKSLTLVSWENVHFSFSTDLLNHSEFINNLPDFGQEIKLEMLGIDTETLRLIHKFMKITEALPNNINEGVREGAEIFPAHSEYREFFSSICEEQLILLILAANKLDLRNLQKACSKMVAKLFKDMTQAEMDSHFSIDELTIDQEDYMRFENLKWPY